MPRAVLAFVVMNFGFPLWGGVENHEDSISIGECANDESAIALIDVRCSEINDDDDKGTELEMPPIWKGRCDLEERMKRLNEMGGSKECETAVIKSLGWLQEQQNADGSWGDKYQCAMTGMAVLAYLGHCETPHSKQFGDTVLKAIVYLINVGMQGDGVIALDKANHTWVFEHAIATYALAETYAFYVELNVDIPNLAKITKIAGEIVMDGQADSGGWNYKYNNHEQNGDNSVGFWQIQAMRACMHTGLWSEGKFRMPSRKAAMFLEEMQCDDGSIGYRNTHLNKSPQLTGGAILALQMLGQGNSSAARKAIRYFRKNNEFKWGTPSADLYYHYYNAQAMMNVGGSKWEKYRRTFESELLEAQHDYGYWSQKSSHGAINDHMATCFATLMLEVYYRFPSNDEL